MDKKPQVADSGRRGNGNQTQEISGLEHLGAETFAPTDDVTGRGSLLDNLSEAPATVDLPPIVVDGNAQTQFGAADMTRPGVSEVDLSPTMDVPSGLLEGLLTSPPGATGKSSKPSKSSGLKTPPSTVGSIIGNYEVLSVLGKGGMGIVYKARHRTLNRVVALKMILHGLHGGSTAIQRFLSEAQAVAALQHPGIVQIFEISEHEGLPYFSLEYVEGEDLHSSLKGQPWGAKPAAELVRTLCEAMQYAHDHQILHRDIKPANILLDAEKRPKISDFGLAKKLDTGDQMTRDGAVMGTPSYMPPEQARGDTAAISPRSDVYSLGAVLYEMITGRAPFVSDSMLDTLVQVIHRDPIQPRELQPGVPIDLETICVKALQKEPVNRYPSCKELGEDLRRYVNGEPILARPISHWERLTRWCRRNPKIAWPTAVASFFVIATAVVSLTAWRMTATQALVIAEERDEANEQRNEADKQRNEADKQKVIANQQQVLAEENAELAMKQANLALQNIQFVVNDVDTKLMQQAGSSGIRIAIMEALSKKWDELDLGMTGGVRGKAIPTLMAVRHKIATTFSMLDRVKEADQEFAKLEKMGRERIVVKEGTDASRMNLAKILTAASVIQRQLDNPKGVELKLLEAREIVRDIVKNPKPEEIPTDANQVQQVLAAVNQNLGVEYLRQGRIADTSVVFAEAVAANQAVLKNIESKPGFAELDAEKRDLQTSELKAMIDKGILGVAYVLMRLGKTEEAIVQYDSAIASRRSELERNPNTLRLKSELAGQLALYGRSLIWLDRLDSAAPILSEAVKLCNEAYQADPEKSDLKRSLIFALYNLGTLRDLQGKKDESLGHFERARGLAGDLYKVSPDEKNGFFLMQAEARVGNGKTAKELSDKLGAVTTVNPEIHLERACALSQLARNADGDEKIAYIGEALTALDRSVTDGYLDPFRISADPDLKPLRDETRFTVLLQKLRTQSRVEK